MSFFYAKSRTCSFIVGCYYLDANEVVKAAPNDIDHMHLTAQGHKELAEALDKKIRDIPREFMRLA